MSDLNFNSSSGALPDLPRDSDELLEEQVEEMETLDVPPPKGGKDPASKSSGGAASGQSSIQRYDEDETVPEDVGFGGKVKRKTTADLGAEALQAQIAMERIEEKLEEERNSAQIDEQTSRQESDLREDGDG